MKVYLAYIMVCYRKKEDMYENLKWFIIGYY